MHTFLRSSCSRGCIQAKSDLPRSQLPGCTVQMPLSPPPSTASSSDQDSRGESSSEKEEPSADLGKILPATLVWHEVTCDVLDRSSMKSKRVSLSSGPCKFVLCWLDGHLKCILSALTL